MRDHLKKVTRWLGYFIAFLIIIAATLVSVGRLLTPYLNEHKPDFENWASQFLNSPVTIHEVYISWNGYTPLLTLNKVTILDKSNNVPTFEIKQIKIGIKIIESLFKQEPILSSIKIKGMDLTIRSKKSGMLNVVGLGNIAIADDFLGGVREANEVIAWIFSQPALGLSDIHVTFFTRLGVKKSITLDELRLLNSNTKHSLWGKGLLNQTIPTGVELALNWQGDRFDLESISANLYLYLEGVSLPQWFKEQSLSNLQIKEGLGSAKIWVDWDKGKLQKIQTQCQFYRLNIYSLLTHKTQLISRLNGHFGWKRDGENQVIAGDDILVDFPHHLWPTTSFSLTLPLASEEDDMMVMDELTEFKKQKLALIPASMNDDFGLKNGVTNFDLYSYFIHKNDNFSLRFSYIDLADLYSVASFSGFIPQEWENILSSIKPRGEISGFDLHYRDGIFFENNKIKAHFSHLSWNKWDNHPGIKDLSGEVAWDGKKGSLILDSQQVKLTYPAFFNEPMVLGKLTGNVQFQKDSDGKWLLYGNNLELLNNDIQIDANATVQIPYRESPQVDLIAYVKVKKAEHFKHYFPTKIANPDLSHWISQAFLGGEFNSGKLILQGRLSQFPFDDQSGKFSFNAEAKNLDFSFAPGWPVLKHVDGTIQFLGHQMIVDIKSGHWLDIPIHDIHGEIPYIGSQQKEILLLNVAIDAPLAQGLRLIQQSPLRAKFGKELMMLQLAGLMQLKLDLNMPLKTPEHSILTGNMAIINGMLNIPAWKMRMDDLNGMIRFTEKSLESDYLTGTWWKQPITLQINTKQPDRGPSYINIQMQGQITNAVLHSLLVNSPYATKIRGGTSYLASLQLFVNELDKPAQLTIDTDLKGMALDLPLGLGKKAEEIIPLKISVMMHPNTPINIKWIYGTKLTAATTIKSSKNGMELYSGELHLGNKGVANFQTEPGMVVSGKFDTLDWKVWKTYFNGPSMQSDQSMKDMLGLLRSIDIEAKKIIGIFQTLNDVHLELIKAPESYVLNVDSTEMTGTVTVPLKSDKKPIQINFKHLYLAPLATSNEPLDPASLPAIELVGEDVRYQNKKLGRVNFAISPIKEGLSIDALRISSALFTLEAGGEWTLKAKKNKTDLTGKLSIANVADFLSEWGSPTVNPVGSSGDVSFNLSWPNAPYSPELSGISGKVDLALSAGHIINLDDATNAKMGFGRVLNLLSVESISRALTLNFSDLTEKGYGFDSMKGRFIFKNGNAYAEAVHMKGSVADIEMSGRIGLVAKDYDMTLKVTPFVTGSIPVVAAIAVNPIVGIAAWAIEKVAGKAVSSATTHRYEVTGTWDKPVWVEK